MSTLKHKKPIIAVTMGDPCGIGPEILARTLTSGNYADDFTPMVIGDVTALKRAAGIVGKELDIQRIDDVSHVPGIGSSNSCCVMAPEELAPEDIRYGEPTRATCGAVVKYIETAVRLALDGEVEAICTCPIHKANLHRHGFSFPGHTEFLLDLTGAETVVMMLAGPRIRVSLVTIHESLRDVPTIINKENIGNTIRITLESLSRDFNLKPVRLAVAGLNPHAGEEGRFGAEEIDLIRPVIESFKGGMDEVSGPYPPDTVFQRAYAGEFDAVVAMYHDQGLIPIKLVHFHEAVNVSLGLPIIRTSVDHGTAYDLAGSGKSNDGSLKAALKLAAFMARNRASNEG